MKQRFSKNFLLKRKPLMVLPILALPFITLGFWALGGGKTSPQQKDSQADRLNTKLPDAHKDERFVDKLSFYDKAIRDSIKLAESIRNDPYYKQDLQTVIGQSLSNYPDALNNSPGLHSGPENSEKKLLEKLAILEQQLQESDSDQQPYNSTTFSRKIDSYQDPEIENLNQTNSEDPQLKQMEGMLDKILDIQHPERVKKKTSEISYDISQIFIVKDHPAYKKDTGFYGVSEPTPETNQNAIQAVIHQTQTLVNGSLVKFRLVSDLFMDSIKINAGNFLYGFATLNNERLEIAIHSIRAGQSIYPVSLEVFDLDGLPGIHIPGAISRDVAKQSADNSLQLLELSSMNPSLKAQATAAGIQTAKSLLSKKVRLVKVVVKAGYKILLKNKTSN